jgi:peptidoglycan/xylan/chitin deacetylase (PgdA/CDA1 family)
VPLLVSTKLPATVFVPTNFIEHRSAFWWDHPVIASRATPELRRQWLDKLHGDGDEIARMEGAASPPMLPSSYRPAGWETIRLAVRDGLELGLHSASHRNMPLLSDAELRQEIYASRATLERNTGVQATSFAFPYGLWDRRTRDLIKAAGFDSAVTLDDGLNTARSDPWALRRVNVPASINAPAFEAWAAGLGPSRFVA